MLQTLCRTKPTDPCRILNAGSIDRILNRWRLPCPSHFVVALEDQLQRIYLFQLWQQVFDVPHLAGIAQV